jgi:protein SCO1
VAAPPGMTVPASRKRRAALAALALAVTGCPIPLLAHKPGKEARLPKIGPAQDFTLVAQNGEALSLHDLRGKVVVVTFIYTSCTDTCPMLTAKLAAIKRKLDGDGKRDPFFIAITVDPERDTPEVLRAYAQAHGAQPPGWAFLTGTTDQIREVTQGYGIYRKKQERGDVDHTFLTSLIDRQGMLRVQYLGVRFKADEFIADVRSLTREGAGKS